MSLDSCQRHGILSLHIFESVFLILLVCTGLCSRVEGLNYAVLASRELEKSNFTRFISLPVPAGASSVTLSQYFNNLIDREFRTNSSLSNNFFPYRQKAASFQTDFTIFFSVCSLNGSQTSVKVPYCTLLSYFNCVFPFRAYISRVLGNNDSIVLQESIFNTSSLTPYSVSVAATQSFASALHIVLQLPQATPMDDVLKRQVFVYYKTYGNMDEVRWGP